MVEEGEVNSQGEVESRFQQEADKNNNHSPFLTSSLGRQSSIYSLTLDEFQHSLCETGKNFGSMNMDEFLSSIWSVEENQAIVTSNNVPLSQTPTEKGLTTIRKQPSLHRQPSLSLPAPLCRKTVDQVWSQIQREQQNNANNDNIQNNTESAPRQPTFGEMTLEDFLVKAGVVREPCAPPAVSQSLHHQQHYINNNNIAIGPSFVMGGGGAGGAVSNVVAPAYHVGEVSGGYVGNGKRDGGGGYHQVGVCFGGSGYGVGPTIGIGGPVSPANSSDGIGNDGAQFGLDTSGLRGRKRMVDGPVEKVVERRQRRMIKNRESAARSRARKQAYTVELEAELNQLKEENSQLKQALAELEMRRKQQCLDEVNVRVQTKAQKAKDKLRGLRRNMSCPL